MTIHEDLFQLYFKAINKIDDYFEYSNESQKDKEYVRGILNELTKEIEDKIREKKTFDTG